MGNGRDQGMMNRDFWTAFFVALVLSVAIYPFSPAWQLVAVIGFLAGIIAKASKRGFISSFGGVFAGWFLLLWMQSLHYPTFGSAGLLAEIMGIGESSWFLIVLLTLLLGASVAGLSGLAGAYLRSVVESRPRGA